MTPSDPRSTPDPRLRLWAWPIALGVLSATGLVSALVSDTWGDWWSWLALGIPTAVMGWYALRRAPAPCPPAPTPSSSSSIPEQQR